MAGDRHPDHAIDGARRPGMMVPALQDAPPSRLKGVLRGVFGSAGTLGPEFAFPALPDLPGGSAVGCR
jgi:hypothetical protein